MPRMVRIWTWDAGSREIDLDWPESRLAPVLQTILDGGLWDEFRKFPPDVLSRLKARLQIPSNTRRPLELWIEEAQARSGA